MLVSNNTTPGPPLISLDESHFDQRTLWDILKGCMATLFACTWASIHPNMLSVDDGALQILLQRIELMIWSLLIPEMVMFWALRQWIGARTLSQAYKEFRWNTVHGFFAQMGGFVIKNRSGIIKVLQPYQMDILSKRRQIEFPKISSKEISDRSGGDPFSKAVILGQTSWFIVQCVVRHTQGLTITQIEISTLSFCALNAVMYFLWWHKPLNARVPIFVRIYGAADTITSPNVETQVINRNFGSPVWRTRTMSYPEGVGAPIPTLTNEEYAEIVGGNALQDNPMSAVSHDLTIRQETSQFNDSSSIPRSSRIDNNGYISTDDERYEVTYTAGESAFKRVVTFPYRRLKEMRECVVYLKNNEEYTNRIPTYYAHARSWGFLNLESLLCHTFILLISSGFGIIHLAAWHTAFPTLMETRLWRGATITIIAAPLLYAVPIILAQVLLYPNKWLEWLGTTWQIPLLKRLNPLYTLAKYVVPGVYIIARITILVEAVSSLRALPASAYATIPWTSYIPHI